MSVEEINVNRGDLSATRRNSRPDDPLQAGEIRLAAETFGLSANNISYAATGDALGYWAHFSRDAEWGVVPVWGFGVVTESRAADIAEGERLFGFLPMANQAVLTPSEVSDLCFSDAGAQRAALLPWYKRYYRCAHDPAFNESAMERQQILWALFMTGWMQAKALRGEVDRVYVSSASSKTALALAWSLRHDGQAVPSVGITSTANRAFVEGLQVYDEIVTYDALATAGGAAGRAAYVDIAGSARVTSDVHVALGDRLPDSILIGATHRAPAAESLPMPGPAPRFFFIPTVADERAAEIGLAAYHGEFAAAWHAFANWAAGWLEIERDSGSEAIEAGYRRCVSGGIPPQRGLVFTWQ